MAQLQHALEAAEGLWGLFVDGVLMGYTAVWQVPGLDGLLEMNGGVHPDYRRQGLGSALLNHVIAACELLPFHTLSFPVDDLNTAVAHFLQQHNFWVEHEEWTMEQNDLSTIIAIENPTSHIETLPREKAISQFLQLYDDSFTGTPWNQPFTQTEVANMLQHATDIQFFIVEQDPVGFVWLHFSDDDPKSASIEPIGIIRDAQGKGYGRIFLTTILRQLAKQQIQQVSLGVWANNHKAISLYQSLGFQQTDARTYLAISL